MLCLINNPCNSESGALEIYSVCQNIPGSTIDLDGLQT